MGRWGMKEKYIVSEDHMSGEESLLQCIANELAEANRLKRLELINTLPEGVSEDTINGDDKWLTQN